MEAKPHAIRFRGFIGRIYSSHAEAGIDQPLLEVSPVQAHVVFLTVSLQALSGIGQGILNGGVAPWQLSPADRVSALETGLGIDGMLRLGCRSLARKTK